MNHRERIEAALNGKDVDRIPYAFWSHFPGVDMNPERLARTTADFYRKYNIDFVKTMPNGMYAIEDFGCRCNYSQIPKGGVAFIEESPVEMGKGWEKIRPLTLSSPALARELYSFDLLYEEIGAEVPILFTVFSPLTIANKLSKGTIMETIRHGDAHKVEDALETIAESVSLLCKAAVEHGAAGVFFATQMATTDGTDESEYSRYGKKYDLMALKGAEEGWMNTIHLHGTNVMFDLISDYPVELLNWHVWETEPDIAEAKEKTKLALMGGIKRSSITAYDKDALRDQIGRAICQSEGVRHILTPGCVIRYPLRDEALSFVETVRDEEWEKRWSKEKTGAATPA